MHDGIISNSKKKGNASEQTCVYLLQLFSLAKHTIIYSTFNKLFIYLQIALFQSVDLDY
jgi:hypothetical protein